MSNDAERSAIGRLWSGGATREKGKAPEQERIKDNVLPLRPDDDRSYKAFETREHPADLHIRCATQPSHFPAYSSLLNIIFDHAFDRVFTLVYSFMLVEVTGKHLGAVVHAISYRNCERITEWHRKLHDQPDPDEPIIDGIKITAAIGGSQRAST